MVRLKNKGEFYNCGSITAKEGEIIEVSPEKAEQLLTDFPKEWEKVDGKKMPKDEGNEISKDNKKGKIKNKK